MEKGGIPSTVSIMDMFDDVRGDGTNDDKQCTQASANPKRGLLNETNFMG